MKILLSNSSKDPFYNQIYEQIKSMILSDELKDGEGLPSMRKLALDLGVSVITVKRAYDELEKESFIFSIVGKGSFVSENNIALIKEKKMQAVEEQLQAVVINSKEIGISLNELQEMIQIFYKE